MTEEKEKKPSSVPADAKALAGRQVSSSNLTKAFPEKEGDFLKVPPVFE